MRDPARGGSPGTGFLSPTKQTFASVADVHVRPIPQGISNTEYRPGAIGLEMPATLVGKRAGPGAAGGGSGRAAAVVDKTRNLITLEVEDGYLKWEDAVLKLRALAQTHGVRAESRQKRAGAI